MNYWAKDHKQKATLFVCDGSSTSSSSSDTESQSSSSSRTAICSVFIAAPTHVARGNLIIDTMTKIFKLVPPSSAAAWLRILANALCTNARFGLAPRPCVFGCACHSDHLAHYLACPVLYGSLDDIFRIGAGSSLFGTWLLNIEVQDDQTTMVIMCIADCMQAAYNSFSNGESTDLRGVILARRRFITLRSESMNEAVNCRIRRTPNLDVN